MFKKIQNVSVCCLHGIAWIYDDMHTTQHEGVNRDHSENRLLRKGRLFDFHWKSRHPFWGLLESGCPPYEDWQNDVIPLINFWKPLYMCSITLFEIVFFFSLIIRISWFGEICHNPPTLGKWVESERPLQWLEKSECPFLKTFTSSNIFWMVLVNNLLYGGCNYCT